MTNPNGSRRTRRIGWKTLTLGHLCLALGLLAAGIWTRYAGHAPEEYVLPPDPTHARPTFHALLTLDYSNGRGQCRIQQEGNVGVDRSVAGADGTVAYAYSYDALTAVGVNRQGVESTLDAAVMLRDPESERYVGGDPAMRTAGLLANAALDQLESRFIPDGSEQVATFRYPAEAPLMPSELTYRLRGSERSVAGLGDVVVVTALSDEFTLKLPDGRLAQARNRLFTVMDSPMELTYLQASRFEARVDGETLAVEDLLFLREGGGFADLAELEAEVRAGFGAIGMDASPSAQLRKPDVPLPTWVVAALVGKNAASVLGGVAIEGRPNFAITATVGSILLADAGLSAGTTVLHEMGVIDWEWRGIPNLLGGLAGRTIAQGYNATQGRTVIDEDMADEAGGLAGDVLSMFMPDKLLAKGATVGLQFGAKSIKPILMARNIDLANKTLRVSRSGVEIVRLGKYGQIAKAYQSASRIHQALDAAKLALDAVQFARNWYQPPNDLPPPKIGDVSFRLYWIPPKDDMDLHVRDPHGNEIWYQKQESPTGGRLDRDDTDSGGPENVYWPTGGAPAGDYECWAEYFAGSGPYRAVLEIREGPRVVKKKQFELSQKGSKTDVLKWRVGP